MNLHASSKSSVGTYPHWIDLRASLSFASLLFLTQALLWFVILQLELPWGIKIGLMLMCLMSSILALRQQALRIGQSAIVRIWQSADGDWLLMDRQGSTRRGILQGDSFIGKWILVLNFKIEARRFWQPVILFFDTLPEHEFRRFRVFLLTSREVGN